MHALLDMLYPRFCFGCGRAAPETLRWLCWDCLSTLPAVEPPFCAWCGDPICGSVTHHFVCHTCSRVPPAFMRARSLFRYDGLVADLLKELKYHGGFWLAEDLARLLHHGVLAEYQIDGLDVVCPVPLHHARRRRRGYNQSDLLAGSLARLLGLDYRANLLRRVRPTPTQTSLTALERAANMRNAFKVRFPGWLKGRRVLLVDDVMTTGATVNECARALRKGGAREVWAVTVARG
jgi:ComF family protein